MEIGRKLVSLRIQKGISQEKIAEIVGVSRQSVAKWESSDSLPEIEKLVALSRYYGVTIDSIVKEHLACEFPSSCLVSYGSRDFISFLCRGKRATYAGHGRELPASRTGSHDLKYSEENLDYYDSYLGSERFCGEEAVWKDGVAVWGMNYAGRVLDEKFSGDFLKDVLSRVSEDLPYRGPLLFKNGDFTYHCEIDGPFEWFSGREAIFFDSVKVYECVFHGGIVS